VTLYLGNSTVWQAAVSLGLTEVKVPQLPPSADEDEVLGEGSDGFMSVRVQDPLTDGMMGSRLTVSFLEISR
jgi:hypothetical protein